MNKKIRFLDLRIKDPNERHALHAAIDAVFDHGQFVLGPEVEEFENTVAQYCGRKHAIGVGTGTDALILGIKALGIGPGDEVITTPLSWLATGSAILLNGASIVFCDIDETLNMDPSTLSNLITERTKAILPVHFAGRLASMPEILSIARKNNLKVIEDGSQAFGASLNGRPCGSFGDIACISLNAMKNLGGIGDAGIITCDDDELAKSLKVLRHSGVRNKEYCEILSHNCRLDTIQAAILLNRIKRYPAIVKRRREIAARYNEELSDLLIIPRNHKGYEDVFYTYTIRTELRDQLHNYLESQGIETRIQHPIIMNDQPAFQGFIRGKSPNAFKMSKEILCLPVHEKLTEEEQTYVITHVRKFILN